MYIKAEAETSTVHFIVDFIGKPSVLIAQTSRNASLHINWTQIIGSSGGINFSEEPKYVVAAVIKTIVLFNDTNDSSNYSDPNVHDVVKFDPLTFTWSVKNLTEIGGQLAVLEMNATNINNGSLSFKVNFFI